MITVPKRLLSHRSKWGFEPSLELWIKAKAEEVFQRRQSFSAEGRILTVRSIWCTTVWWIQSRDLTSDLIGFPLKERASCSLLGTGGSPGRLRDEVLSCGCAVLAAPWPCTASGCSPSARRGTAALTVSSAAFEGKAIWSLLCAAQCSGPVSSSRVKSSSDSSKTCKSADPAEPLGSDCGAPGAHPWRSPGSAACWAGLGGGALPGRSGAALERARRCWDRAAAGDGTAPPVATDNKRVATESVNSFRVWLNNSSKWKQMLISSGTAGAEGNEWTFAAPFWEATLSEQQHLASLVWFYCKCQMLVSRLVLWQLIDLQHLIC